MTEFLGDPDVGGFLTDPAPSVEPVKGQISTEQRRQDLQSNTGLTREELQGVSDSNAVAFSHSVVAIIFTTVFSFDRFAPNTEFPFFVLGNPKSQFLALKIRYHALEVLYN